MWIAGTVVVLVSMFLAYPQPDLKLEQDILPLARKYASSNNNNNNSKSTTASATATADLPLKDVRVVITGATGGIGLGLVEQFSAMGATVIALGRSPSKLKALKEVQFPGADITIVPIEVQLTDLESVKTAAEQIASQFDRIDILINNAGIHYAGTGTSVGSGATSDHPTTPQGLDLSWGVNYMSHFLLTEKLLEQLKASPYQPTVIQISSTFHFAVDGSELMATTTTNDKNDNKNTGNPLASIPGLFTKGIFGPQRAYANSKLAQILHARALARRHPEWLSVKSICPCWVGTGIAGSNNVVEWVLGRTAYPNNGFGIKSALMAALDNNDNDNSNKTNNDFYTNSESTTWALRFLPTLFYSSWSYSYRLRDAIAMAYGGVMWTFQRFFTKVEARTSSPESYDEALQESLYHWSYETVKPFL